MNDLDFHENDDYGESIDASTIAELQEESGWNPIGFRVDDINTSTATFNGIFEGLGNKISNLYINRNENGQGLFANLSGATIRNLIMENANISAATTAGVITAGMHDNSVIENCKVSGTIDIASDTTSSPYKGLLVGYMDSNGNNRVSNCHTKGIVIGNGYIGGLIGFANRVTISHSHSEATITGNNSIGGLIGYAALSTIYNTYSFGNVEGKLEIGGLIGSLISTVQNSYSTVTVRATSSESKAGGLIGNNGDYTGLSDSEGFIYNCYSTGDVIIPNTNNSGILVGQNGSSSFSHDIVIINSYGLGNINGNENIGLVGVNNASIENVFNGGQVTGNANFGNIVGLNAEGADIYHSFSVPQNNVPNPMEGTIVSINDIKSSNWFKNVLNFELEENFKNNWYYEDGYYPLLYKIDENGNPTTTLLEGQVKRKIE